MNLVAPVPIGVVMVAVLVAAITDFRAYKIYNLLTLPLLASGLIYHGVVGGWSGFAGSLLGAVIGLALLFLFFLMGGMGGGDVKLMAGIGAWLGAPATLMVLAVACVAAGICAVILMFVHGRARDTWLNFRIMWHRIASIGRHFAADDAMEQELSRSENRGRVIPFGAMVAIGVAVVFAQAYFRSRS